MTEPAAERLLDRFYRDREGWVDGTTEFHNLIGGYIDGVSRILEVGQGIDNATSSYLASHGRLDGIDPDPVAATNSSVTTAWEWQTDGSFPIEDETYDLCVSDYVVEHVADPDKHLGEIARVLKPGGHYLYCTPNRGHYVAIGARLTPHKVHLLSANWLRARPVDASDPFPTQYRMNTRQAARGVAAAHGFKVVELRMIEKEPSYLVRSRAAFMLGVGYERLVNSHRVFEGLRVNMLVVLKKLESPGTSS